MNKPIYILYLDNSPYDRTLVRNMLETGHGDFCLTEVAAYAEFEAELAQGDYDLVLSDFHFGDFDGLQVLEAVQARDPRLPVIFITATGSEEVAVEALRRGAADYVIKTFSHLQRLPHTIQAVLEKKHLQEERERAEEALREASQLNQQIIASAQEGIVVYDRELRYLVWNPYMEKLLGVPAAQVLGKRPWEAFPSLGEQQDWLQPVKRALAGETVIQDSYLSIPPPGRPVWISRKHSPLKNSQGEIIGVIGMGRDITERKQAEEALRQAEANYRALVEQIPGVIYTALLDDFGSSLYISPQLEAVLGFSPAEWLADPHLWYKQLHPADRERILAHNARCRATGEPFRHEYRLLTRDGQVVWVRDEGIVHSRGPDQAPLIQGVWLDITERKRAEEALQASEQQLSLIYEHVSDVLFYLAVEAEEHYRFLSVNRAFLQATGLAEHQVVGKLVTEVIPEPTRALVLGKYREAIRERKTARWEEVSVYPAGEKYGEVSVTPVFDATGNCTHLTGIVHDITERKQAEAALQMRVRQQAAIAALGQRALARTDLSTLMDEAVAVMANTLEVEFCKILELLPGGQTLLLRAGVGWQEGLVGRAVVEAGTNSQAGYTLLSHEPVIVEDLRTEARFSGPPLLAGHGVVSGMSVIIAGRERPFGVLGAHTRQRRTFTIDDIHFLQAVANLLAAVIEREQVAAAEREQRALAEALADTAAALNSTLDFDQVLERILDNVGRVVPHDAADILRVDSAGMVSIAHNRGYAERGLADWTQTRRFPLAGLPSLIEAIKRERPLIIPDTRAYPGWVDIPETRWIRSYLCAPLGLKAQIIGFISLSSVTPNHYTATHAERLQTFANQAIIALQNAQLLAESERRAAELAALYQTGQRLQQLYTPKTLAQEIIRILEEILAYEFGAVLLLDETTGRLIPFALSEQGRGPAFVEADKARIAAHDIRLGRGITGWVAQTGQSICLGDVRQEPRYIAVRDDIRSELCVPLHAGDQIMGVVNIETTRLNAYTEADRRLLETVAAQIAVAIQNARLYEQVQAGRERLEVLSRRLLAAQESERRLIARELHDEIGQTLSMVKIDLQAMQRLPAAAGLESHLAESIALAERALQQVRSLSVELRPSLLDDLGLVPALRWYLDRQAQRAGFVADLVTDSLEARLPAEVETVCFRVAQEALTNTLRHAQAHHVTVELRQCQAELSLAIRDDGVGFDAPAALNQASSGASLGLLSMQERVLLAGGQFEIESRPGEGTEIRARFPLKGDSP